jgi:hypothetical protein
VRKVFAWLLLGAGLVAAGCGRKRPAEAPAPRAALPPPAKPARLPIPSRPALAALGPGETYRYDGGVATRTTIEAARAAGLLDVDLSDGWAPFIFQDGGGPGDAPRPNGYRATFVTLANEKIDEDGQPLGPHEHDFLEVFGIPPALTVLAARFEEDLAPAREACYDGVDLPALRRWTGNLGFLDREHSKREFVEAERDAAWVDKEAAARGADREATLGELRDDPKTRGRVDRYLRGQGRLAAVRAAQARLSCEGLLRGRFVSGQYDLPTHEALADWERKNDIFGWGFLGGETAGVLQRPTRGLHLDTFKRVLAERVADAAGIVEDGSLEHAFRRNPASWVDEAGVSHPVPNLIGQHVDALLAALGVATPEDLAAFLRAHAAGLATLHVAFKAPALPDYYRVEPGAEMALSAEIDRGDVWYDFPFDAHGKPLVQRRDHYPHLTLYVTWHGQRIPLVWWRTTIGTWRSEMHEDGHVYMKYKQSDVGPRVWKNIVAAPVWVPPDGTQPKDLLTRKVFDRNVGPVTVVNTGVMGPGFQSAYGLVMAIHIDPKRGGFDNQIRTHGSVDYTSIARRFSHGCHRLVNDRAVRLFDFVLRHRAFQRIGNVPMSLKKRFEVEGEPYRYELTTRGYYYELRQPVPVNVLEGRIMGEVKKPILAYKRKPGVDYSDAPAADGDAATSTRAPLDPGAEPGP